MTVTGSAELAVVMATTSPVQLRLGAKSVSGIGGIRVSC
jgi:hypothetical protein